MGRLNTFGPMVIGGYHTTISKPSSRGEFARMENGVKLSKARIPQVPLLRPSLLHSRRSSILRREENAGLSDRYAMDRRATGPEVGVAITPKLLYDILPGESGWTFRIWKYGILKLIDAVLRYNT